jgi:hypothetical protein
VLRRRSQHPTAGRFQGLCVFVFVFLFWFLKRNKQPHTREVSTPRAVLPCSEDLTNAAPPAPKRPVSPELEIELEIEVEIEVEREVELEVANTERMLFRQTKTKSKLFLSSTLFIFTYFKIQLMFCIVNYFFDARTNQFKSFHYPQNNISFFFFSF